MVRRQRQSGVVNAGEIERWSSLVGGGGVVLYGLGRRSLGGLAVAALGCGLILLGASGRRPLTRVLGLSQDRDGVDTSGVRATGIIVEQSVTVDRPAAEAYQAWRRLENLPRFMPHLAAVTTGADGRSHWVAIGPFGGTLEWDAEIINDLDGKLIAWRSLGAIGAPAAGFVRFAAAPDGRAGTVVTAALDYRPQRDIPAAIIATLLRRQPHQQVAEDLRRFKALLEAAELTVSAQQQARPGQAVGDVFQEQRNARLDTASSDTVRQASEESFPASDAPAWTSSSEAGIEQSPP